MQQQPSPSPSLLHPNQQQQPQQPQQPLPPIMAPPEPVVGEREAEMVLFAKTHYSIDLIPPFAIENRQFVDTICNNFTDILNDDERYKQFIDTTNRIISYSYFNNNQAKQQTYLQSFTEALQCFSQSTQCPYKKESLVRNVVQFICHANIAYKASTKVRKIAEDVTKFTPPQTTVQQQLQQLQQQPQARYIGEYHTLSNKVAGAYP